MKLLTPSLIRKFPPLESTDDEDPKNIIIPCRFILPGTKWVWWPFEFDGEDTFFGLVDGDCRELGTFTLDELRQRRGPMRTKVIRDRYFSSCRLSDIW